MYLLDTNALIIFLRDDLATSSLTESSMQIMKHEHDLCVSIVSLWEMALKKKIGKLNLDVPLSVIEDECAEEGISIIPMASRYMDKMVELPLMPDHGDPFDRMIMATALAEGMTLISTDHKVRRKEYGVNVIW